MSKDKHIEMIGGQLFLVTELDGESFLAHGACEKRTKVTLNDLVAEPGLFRRGEELLVSYWREKNKIA